jgi:phosphodiesterase/alkaline phosphatase D-like protein
MSFDTGPGGAPVVTTGAASAITASAATLAGTVDPHGAGTAFAFEYGTTTAFGSISAIDDAGATNGVHAVALAIGGLLPGTTYRYRIVATNAAGTTAGPSRTFTTAPAT